MSEEPRPLMYTPGLNSRSEAHRKSTACALHGCVPVGDSSWLYPQTAACAVSGGDDAQDAARWRFLLRMMQQKSLTRAEVRFVTERAMSLQEAIDAAMEEEGARDHTA